MAEHSVEAVLCPTALTTLRPLRTILPGIHRILLPGGLLLATVLSGPAEAALWTSENRGLDQDPAGVLARHGFVLLDDDRRLFGSRHRRLTVRRLFAQAEGRPTGRTGSAGRGGLDGFAGSADSRARPGAAGMGTR